MLTKQVDCLCNAKISEGEHPLQNTLTEIYSTFLAHSNVPNYHKTDISCKGLIAVSVDNQN